MSGNEQKFANLAINGGPKTRNIPWPGRGHFGVEEKCAADALFDKAIETGTPSGYNGEAEEAYCREFAEFMGGGYCDAVNSGTTAVYVALRALELEPFTEIIVSGITDPGGMMPIPLMNCIPIVADTAPGSYNVGPEQVEPLISPLTSAIIISHIGGEPADIAGIVELARKHDIPVVEDCSQAHGAKLNGRILGTFGDIAAFSTMFGKHHCTGGQGGIVYTQSEALYWSTRRVSDRGKPFGLESGATNSVASLNFNLNDLAGAIGSEQLKKLPWIISKRQEIAEKLIGPLGELKSITIPETLKGAEHAYWWWRLKVNLENISCSKMEYCKALQAEGIELLSDYSIAIPSRQDWFVNKRVFGTSSYPWACPLYKGDPNRDFLLPNAVDATARHFNLTIMESWQNQELDDIVAAFRKIDDACVI